MAWLAGLKPSQQICLSCRECKKSERLWYGGWDTLGTKAEQAEQKLSLLCPFMLPRPLPILRFGLIHIQGGWVDKNRELFCCQQRLQVNIMDRKSPSPLCSPSLPFPSSPHPPSPTMHCLRASRVCCSVLTAHSTFSGSRLKLGGLGQKKRLVTNSARASGERSRGRKGQNNPGPASCHTAVRART